MGLLFRVRVKVRVQVRAMVRFGVCGWGLAVWLWLG